MKVKLALRKHGSEPGYPIEDVEYEDAQYDVSGSFIVITLSNGPEKVFPVHRVHFVEVTP
jgi:hypothetical protein